MSVSYTHLDVYKRQEQVGTVAEGGHIGGVHSELFFAHNVNGNMGEIEVFQRDRADVVVIRHLIGVRT